jgi:hypothetical protein
VGQHEGLLDVIRSCTSGATRTGVKGSLRGKGVESDEMRGKRKKDMRQTRRESKEYELGSRDLIR